MFRKLHNFNQTDIGYIYSESKYAAFPIIHRRLFVLNFFLCIRKFDKSLCHINYQQNKKPL